MRLRKSGMVMAVFGVAGALAASQALADSMLTREEINANTRAALAAGKIAHGEASYSVPRPVVSATSRAAVNTATVAALAAGEIPHGEFGVAWSDDFESTRSRAAVRAETREAVRNGEIQYGEAEPS